MPRITKPLGYNLRGGSAGNVKGQDKRAMLEVACPRCHMAAGWVCMTENGKWSSTAHAARVQAYAALTAGQT